MTRHNMGCIPSPYFYLLKLTGNITSCFDFFNNKDERCFFLKKYFWAQNPRVPGYFTLAFASVCGDLAQLAGAGSQPLIGSCIWIPRSSTVWGGWGTTFVEGGPSPHPVCPLCFCSAVEVWTLSLLKQHGLSLWIQNKHCFLNCFWLWCLVPATEK